MGVAVFDYPSWAARFPALAPYVSEPFADALFGDAGYYLDNTDTSVVQDVARRLSLLNLIVAHLAVLQLPANQGGLGLVGRISNATQGSVSVASEYKTESESAAFWSQTTYGAQFWALSKWIRSATFVPAPTRYMGVPWGGGPSWRS